jgi:tetratricopeptide (TPR) repeat protein
MKKLVGFVLLLFQVFLSGFSIKAQDSTYIKLRSEAQFSFQSMDFKNALSLYQKLLSAYPKEPEYSYSAGVCLVHLNQNLDEAILHLQSATVANYNPLAWYYLGRAFHLNYLFEDAIKAYSRYILLSKKSDIKELEVERQIEMAKNGIEFTSSGHSVKVRDTKTIQANQLEIISEINGSGKFIKKPIEFCSKSDLRNGYRPFMFLPVYTEINEYVYVSGYDKPEITKTQIFRIKNINHETWSIPEVLDNTINTPYDEEYPFYDEKNSILYFSSKGHSSMGGYDIFKSTYDWNTKSWSKPENMGFPINSPFDDFLFITDEFSQTAAFASSRKTGPGQLTIFKIEMEQDTTGTRFADIDEIRKASQLLVISEPKPPITINGETEFTQLNDSAIINSSEMHMNESTHVKNNYNTVLASAMILQLKADSLARIAMDKRILAKETPDQELKKQLVTDIIRVEKEAKRTQREADRKFVEAGKIKDIITLNESKDSLLILAKEIEGIKVFKYRSENIPLTQAGPEMTIADTASSAKNNLKRTPNKKEDEFVILESSPYTSTNPIPEGLGFYDGLIYRIQLGAFSKPRPDDSFGGISPLSFEKLIDNGIYKYYAGIFYSLNSVTAALNKLRASGFPDAFIVAFLNGKPITTEKAREIEFSGFKL